MRGIHATPDEHTRIDDDDDTTNANNKSKVIDARTSKGAQHEDATRVTDLLNSNEEQDAYKAYYAKKWGYVEHLPKTNISLGDSLDCEKAKEFDNGKGNWTMDTMNFRGR